jgi:hypothetical protein
LRLALVDVLFARSLRNGTHVAGIPVPQMSDLNMTANGRCNNGDAVPIAINPSFYPLARATFGRI